MAKYDERFKLKVVKQYLSSLESLARISAEHGVGASIVRRWVRLYEAHGASGLLRKGASYDAHFKLKVLKRMQREHWNQEQTAAAFNIRFAGHIGKWARQYHNGGLDALQPRRRGRPKSMSTKRTKSPKVIVPESELTDKQIIARQNQELIELRAEVAYLKKLDALIQEKRATAQKKPKQ